MKTAAIYITLLITGNLYAQTPEEAIARVFDGMSDAWEQGDADAWGSYFSEDADFTVWFGLHLAGRKAITSGHQWLFESVYPDTRYEFEINHVKFLSEDVVIVHLMGSVISPGENVPDDPHTLPVAVLQKLDGTWKVVMFHNLKNRTQEMETARKNGIQAGDVRK